MFSHSRPVWAEINLDNLAHNMREIRRIAKSKYIIAVVKADAYGHGALDVAPVLLENGATHLAVATLRESLELIQGGITEPIIILGYTPKEQLRDVISNDLQQTVFTYKQASEIDSMAKELNKTAKIHIKIDTGMGRIGFLSEETSIDEVYNISKLSNISIEGLFSHFSTADEIDKEYTKIQLEKFNWVYDSLKKRNVSINMRHMANSAGIIDVEDSHFEGVRPGIILYGYYPSNQVSKEKIYLKPVMSIKVNIIHIKKLKVGEYISYGRDFITERESIIATLPIGYGDGYTRILGKEARVIVKGHYAPVVGRICMDQCMIDITNIPGVQSGDEVIILGEEGTCIFNADNMADIIGTINYEILCMVSKRVPRVYLKEGIDIKTRNYV